MGTITGGEARVLLANKPVILLPLGSPEVYTSGVAKGDPLLSSAQTGARLTEQLTEICARFVQHFAERVPA